MGTRVLGVPISWLVAGLVAWKMKFAGTGVTGAIPQLIAEVPELITLAKAVATAPPTCTDRLDGSVAANRGLVGGGGAKVTIAGDKLS